MAEMLKVAVNIFADAVTGRPTSKKTLSALLYIVAFVVSAIVNYPDFYVSQKFVATSNFVRNNPCWSVSSERA